MTVGCEECCRGDCGAVGRNAVGVTVGCEECCRGVCGAVGRNAVGGNAVGETVESEDAVGVTVV